MQDAAAVRDRLAKRRQGFLAEIDDLRTRAFSDASKQKLDLVAVQAAAWFDHADKVLGGGDELSIPTSLVLTQSSGRLAASLNNLVAQVLLDIDTFREQLTAEKRRISWLATAALAGGLLIAIVIALAFAPHRSPGGRHAAPEGRRFRGCDPRAGMQGFHRTYGPPRRPLPRACHRASAAGARAGRDQGAAAGPHGEAGGAYLRLRAIGASGAALGRDLDRPAGQYRHSDDHRLRRRNLIGR